MANGKLSDQDVAVPFGGVTWYALMHKRSRTLLAKNGVPRLWAGAQGPTNYLGAGTYENSEWVTVKVSVNTEQYWEGK